MFEPGCDFIKKKKARKADREKVKKLGPVE